MMIRGQRSKTTKFLLQAIEELIKKSIVAQAITSKLGTRNRKKGRKVFQSKIKMKLLWVLLGLVVIHVTSSVPVDIEKNKGVGIIS